MSRLIERCKAIALNLGSTRQRLQLADLFLEESLVHPNEEASHDSEISEAAEIEFNKISDDLLFKILISLPAASLFAMQFVCKKWFSLINTSFFIRSHAQQSETVMICNCSTSLKSCDHESLALKPFFRFLDLGDGGNSFVDSSIIEPFNIQVSYDGLILATTQNGKSLILMNPITRKHIMLPSSTGHRCFLQSFGIAFCDKAKTYKIIHIFAKASGDVGCSIMSIRTRCWRSIEEPRTELCPDVRQAPISMDGSLYWTCFEEGSDYLVSFSLRDEKFVPKNLPIRVASTDQLLEIGGCLGLATRVEPDLMQVWILVSDGGFRERWMKKCSINVSGFEMFPHAICCSRNGEGIVVEKGSDLYVYKFEKDEMKMIHSSLDRVWYVRRGSPHIPHRNTLLSLHDFL